MDQKGQWRLTCGCHSGTMISRDMLEEKKKSLEECRSAFKAIKEGWQRGGLKVWFATAHGPSGEKETLDEGVPYN